MPVKIPDPHVGQDPRANAADNLVAAVEANNRLNDTRECMAHVRANYGDQ